MAACATNILINDLPTQCTYCKPNDFQWAIPNQTANQQLLLAPDSSTALDVLFILHTYVQNALNYS
jgi:hypothetical protein